MIAKHQSEYADEQSESDLVEVIGHREIVGAILDRGSSLSWPKRKYTWSLARPP